MTSTTVEPYLFVIIGGTGDLAQRKLLPAFYNLIHDQDIMDQGRVLGVARNQLDDAEYRDRMVYALQRSDIPRREAEEWASTYLYYQPLPEGTPEEYTALADRIRALEEEFGLPGNRVFYLAIPPQVFTETIHGLGEAGLNSSPGWTRLVIEKPFGRDLESARELNRIVHAYFEESQIYRIDHYLGKETVQNLLAFRFANSIFESLWNRDRVERVEMIVAEDIGIEGRAGYYEQAGALRDIVQNHLTQLLTIVAMEVPGKFSAESIRFEKVKVLRSIEPIGEDDVIFGQYTAGKIDGKEVPGYLEEDGVAPDSNTETFVAIKVHINNWRWQGVPFIVRAGKRLPRRLTQIAVIFRTPPVRLFQEMRTRHLHPNVLLITVQPNEGFSLGFEVKVPGGQFTLQKEYLHFRYQDAFGRIPEAYETLFLDILTGDQTLFVHAEEAEKSWEIWTPLLEKHIRPRKYPAGTWGPFSADDLLELDESDYMLPAIMEEEVAPEEKESQ